jgi:uracil-DNA glycosylase
MAAHPAARIRTLAELHEAIAGCRLCPRVSPPPILWALEGQRALIVGQAPGITEPQRGLPFAGAAGRKLIGWLAPLGIADHDDMLERFAFAAVAKCYPGRLPGGRGDRAPDRGERERCLPWTDALVRICDPAVVVPVGRLAIDDWIGRAPLSELIGRRFERDGRAVIPLPHPSGASSWTNDPGNRALVAEAVSQLRDTIL